MPASVISPDSDTHIPSCRIFLPDAQGLVTAIVLPHSPRRCCVLFAVMVAQDVGVRVRGQRIVSCFETSCMCADDPVDDRDR